MEVETTLTDEPVDAAAADDGDDDGDDFVPSVSFLIPFDCSLGVVSVPSFFSSSLSVAPPLH